MKEPLSKKFLKRASSTERSIAHCAKTRDRVRHARRRRSGLGFSPQRNPHNKKTNSPAVASVQQFFVIVADSRRVAQALKRIGNFGTQAFCSFRAVVGYVEQDFSDVGFSFRRQQKAPLHRRLAFFFTRARCWMSSRSSSNTSSPSSSSPRAACAAPRANLAFSS